MYDLLYFFYLKLHILLADKSFFGYVLRHGSIPFALEACFFLALGTISIFQLFISKQRRTLPTLSSYPRITCIVTCYGEGQAIISTLKSLIEQDYLGEIEILIVIDSANANYKTVAVAKSFLRNNLIPYNRILKIVPKPIRGGLVSSSNLGLNIATGQIAIRVDGDTSCHKSSVTYIADSMLKRKSTFATSATVLVRNNTKNLLTRMQDIEYKVGIQFSRIGLEKLGCINNISGAFGGFNVKILKKIGGWRNGTAEDLDLTTRLHAYKKRYPQYFLAHAEQSICYTEVPETVKSLFLQRLRWDGDMTYILLKRNHKLIRPKHNGWLNFLMTIFSGVFLSIGMAILLPFALIYVGVVAGLAYLALIMTIMYLYYTVVSFFFFFAYTLLISDSKKQDFISLLLIPLFTPYKFMLRLFCFFATVSEIVFSTHKDSSMAPQSVLKKVDK